MNRQLFLASLAVVFGTLLTAPRFGFSQEQSMPNMPMPMRLRFVPLPDENYKVDSIPILRLDIRVNKSATEPRAEGNRASL